MRQTNESYWRPLWPSFAGGTLAAGDREKDFAAPPDESKPWVFMWVVRPDKARGHHPAHRGTEIERRGWRPAVRLLPGCRGPLPERQVAGTVPTRGPRGDPAGAENGGEYLRGLADGRAWITTENSSWMVVSSETVLTGPRSSPPNSPSPGAKESSMDVVVHAFPIPAGTPALSRWSRRAEPGGDPQPAGRELQHRLHSGATGSHGSSSISVLRTSSIGPIDVTATWPSRPPTTASHLEPVAKSCGPLWHLIYEAVPAATARWFRSWCRTRPRSVTSPSAQGGGPAGRAVCRPSVPPRIPMGVTAPTKPISSLLP